MQDEVTEVTQEDIDEAINNADEPDVEPEDSDVEQDDDEQEDSDVEPEDIEQDEPAEVPEKAPEWVRELRKNYRKVQKEKQELEAQLRATRPTSAPTVTETKPTLEDADYDTELYESRLENWYKKQNERELAQEKRAQSIQAKTKEYDKEKAKFDPEEYEDSELMIQSTLSETQQGIIIHGSDNVARLVYELGRLPTELKKLSAIEDPVKFAFAVSRLEDNMNKSSQRKPTTTPEKTVKKSGASISGSVDSTLDRLRTEAAKTGDMSKVFAYKMQRRK